MKDWFSVLYVSYELDNKIPIPFCLPPHHGNGIIVLTKHLEDDSAFANFTPICPVLPSPPLPPLPLSSLFSSHVCSPQTRLAIPGGFSSGISISFV